MSLDANAGLASVEDRLDRLESHEQIRALPYRYALAVDTRNLDDLVALFVEDVQVNADKHGREALRAWFAKSLSRFGDTIHLVANHLIEFDSKDEARGIVTCRDEVEIKGEWRIGVIQYWDKYSRRDGVWQFKRRKLHRWYLIDALSRPSHGGGLEVDGESLGVGLLPDSWPSWEKFWTEVGRAPRR